MNIIQVRKVHSSRSQQLPNVFTSPEWIDRVHICGLLTVHRRYECEGKAGSEIVIPLFVQSLLPLNPWFGCFVVNSGPIEDLRGGEIKIEKITSYNERSP